jgi:E3 ubiquitin-protein ligase UBR4
VLCFLCSQVLARLRSLYLIQRISLTVHNPRKSKCISSLAVWFCDTPITDLQQVKAYDSSSSANTSTTAAAAGTPVWKLAAAEVMVAPGQTNVVVDFDLPLLACGLVVELTGVHVSLHEAASEVLYCPRCSHVVTDRHGTCSYCRWADLHLWVVWVGLSDCC